jgi:two-component system sensor histidine kinase KdpD
MSSAGPIGVLGVTADEADDLLPTATASALQSFADQAAIAIERTRLVEKAAKAVTDAESERLRNALLTSVSHDLRTPLASILGSATSLRQLGDRMDGKDRADLLATIEEEAMRLSAFVANLLDMTRLESGVLDIRHDWIDVRDVVSGAAARADRLFPDRRMEMALEPNLPLVRGDAALLTQMVFNLLDNAHKYSPPGSITKIAARRSASGVEIVVSDRGSGIPADALNKVFDKFYRVSRSDGRAPGTGLGLSIAAAIVTALGGTISAQSPLVDGNGTAVTITLPAVDARAPDMDVARGET